MFGTMGRNKTNILATCLNLSFFFFFFFTIPSFLTVVNLDLGKTVALLKDLTVLVDCTLKWSIAY
jgi:hypothetical protein